MKRNRKKFEESLTAWGEAQARALEDIKVVLNRRGELDVQKDLGIDTPYFFISQEQSLYMRKARLNNGELEVLASENIDSNRCRYSLCWEDISQDVITLHDFMDGLYEFEKKKSSEEKPISSFDIILSPMVNVELAVKDPYNLTEDETEELVRLAREKIIEEQSDVLTSENLEIIKLYEENVNDGPLDVPKVIYTL